MFDSLYISLCSRKLYRQTPSLSSSTPVNTQLHSLISPNSVKSPNAQTNKQAMVVAMSVSIFNYLIIRVIFAV